MELENNRGASCQSLETLKLNNTDEKYIRNDVKK